MKGSWAFNPVQYRNGNGRQTTGTLANGAPAVRWYGSSCSYPHSGHLIFEYLVSSRIHSQGHTLVNGGNKILCPLEALIFLLFKAPLHDCI